MGIGISLRDLTGDPRISLEPGNAESTAPDGSENFDNWIYTVDIDQFDGDPNQVITITGDRHRSDDVNIDGFEGSNDGEYGAAQIFNPSAGSTYFGNLNLDAVTGNMEWSFTYQDLIDNAGLNFEVYFVGKYALQQSDPDLLKIAITCFLPGTMIATLDGETAVEALGIGDMIRTADGREVAVKWVGRKTMRTLVFLDGTMLPVRVGSGAFGNGLPVQDLYLSANHGIIIDGMLVNAGAMVNGDTIRFVALEDMPDSFTYYHIETENHDEILANDAPVETFVDYVGRTGFENCHEYLALYGADHIIAKMNRPRISARRQLPQMLREKLGVTSFTDAVTDEISRFLARAA